MRLVQSLSRVLRGYCVPRNGVLACSTVSNEIAAAREERWPPVHVQLQDWKESVASCCCYQQYARNAVGCRNLGLLQ